MPKLMRRILMALLMVLAGCSMAFADKRVALVVGNSAYSAVAPLANPANDATDVAAKLKGLGFTVITGIDLDVAGFDQTVRDFSAAMDGADTALFYYAGHGVQAFDQNYLLPVDAKFDDVSGLKRRSVALADVIGEMQARAGTVLVFVDACRDNPLADTLRAGGRSAGGGRGLARVDVVAKNTLVVFATGPGKIAEDGDTRNSPFTQAFLANADTADLEIESMMKRVSAGVLATTKGKQEPERLSRLTSEFYFVPKQGGAPAPTPVPVPPDDADAGAAEAFAAAKAIGTVAALDAFIARYPRSFYADLAKGLRGQKAGASATLPVPAALPPPAEARSCKWFGASALLHSEGYCATSVAAPGNGNNYEPGNLGFANSRTAWCEGVGGDGVGETVVYRMDPAQSFSSISVENGYTKSQDIYDKNSRPRLVRLKGSDGQEWEAELTDSLAAQTIRLPKRAGLTWVSLTILSVYPGWKYQDTCLSYFRPDFGG